MAIGTPLPRRDRRRSSILRPSGIGTAGTVGFVSSRATEPPTGRSETLVYPSGSGLLTSDGGCTDSSIDGIVFDDIL
ncbi:unnamed protein product [Penicillium pancosmium]